VCDILQGPRADDALQVELAEMTVQDHKALLTEQQAEGEAQPFDVALLGSCPRAQVPDQSGQRIERPSALPAKKMQFSISIGSPDFVTHRGINSSRPFRFVEGKTDHDDFLIGRL
jgi:hypothetical protein